MNKFGTMQVSGGVGRGYSLPNTGNYDGELFEVIDNFSNIQLYSWNEFYKKWVAFSGGGGGTYQNDTPMPISLGGYSVGTTFSEPKTIQEMLDGLLYPYVAPSANLSSIPSSGYQEFGTSIPTVQLNANITKKSCNIVKIEYYKNGTLINTNSSPSSSGGSDSYIDSIEVNSTTSYYIKVYDDKPNSVNSGNVTFNFIYGFYYGVGNPNLTTNEIQLLTKSIKPKSNTVVVTSPSNQVYYYAYLKSYGFLNDIVDQNGFSIIGDYKVRTENFTMLDGTIQQYYVYEFKNLVNSNNFTVTYKF